MSSCFRLTLITLVVSVASLLATEADADLGQAILDSADQYSSESSEVGASDDPMGQVTSVADLSDVQPTDWAFQALQSLVESYGCIAGYPNGTYQGDRAMTRYEFAAGLNACLNRIEELIASQSSSVTSEDLATAQRLREDFSAELTSLGNRVDSLEARTSTLEGGQFSTTTRLEGIANFVLASALSGEGDDEVNFQERIRLTLNTSFTGQDLLVTRIAAGNSNVFNLAGGTREGILSNQWYGGLNNDAVLVTLYYLFPINQQLLGLVTAAGGLHGDYTSPFLNPLFEDYDGGRTSLSTFAQRNPIYRLGGGSGVALAYTPNKTFTLSAGYYGGEAFNPNAGSGLFGGTYSGAAVLTVRPNDKLAIGLGYHHGYFSEGQFAFGDNSGLFGIPGFVGTGVVNRTLAQFPTVTNSYGVDASWRVSPNFAVGGWAGLTKVRAIGTGDGEAWNYALTMAFPDLGKKGNLGGIVVGAEPYLGNLDGVGKIDNDTSLHIEGFYKHQLTDNIAVTPGVIWITAPNQNKENEDIVTGVVRMTFTF